MKKLFVSPVTWKMAWRNLRAHPRQTVLSVLGGCIGAALIVAAVIFFQSFDQSGDRWMQKHFGPIDWELRPAVSQPYFQPVDVSVIREKLAPVNLQLLSAVTVETTVTKLDGNLQPVSKGVRYLAVGLPWEEAEAFEPGHPAWTYSLNQDQVILSEAVALPLSIQEGDTIALTESNGGEQLYKVKGIVKEEGISGYRGLSNAQGTVLMGITSARQLAEIPDDTITSILASSGYVEQASKAPHFPVPFPEFTVVEQKGSAIQQVDQLKLRYGYTFILCSITAIAAGMLLMLQIMLMLGDSRKESFALLRALGYQRKQTKHIFFAETTVLSLLSTGLGVVVGIPLGILVIGAFQWFNRDLLLTYSAHAIPIQPFVSPAGITAAALAIMGLLAFTSAAASWRLGRMNIVSALRGEDSELEKTGYSRSAWIRILLIAGSVSILLLHGYQLFSGRGLSALQEGTNPLSGQGGIVLLVWLVSSAAALYIVVQALPLLQKLLKPLLRLLGFGEAVQMLASRYPARNYRRTLVVTLLFSSCFMVLTFISIMNHHLSRDMARNPYTLLEFPAYVKYDSEVEKQQILAVLNNDEELSGLIGNPSILEPYMVRSEIADLLTDGQLNLTVPTEAFLQDPARLPKLSGRSDEFATDEEAWLAVLTDPRYTIWDHKYSYGAEEWPELSRKLLSTRGLLAGEQLTLEIYEKPAQPNTPRFGQPPEKAGAAEVKIAGFVDTSTGMEFYNVVFVNQQLYDQFREQGYRWEYLTEQGYVMLPLESASAAELRHMEERFNLLGISGFTAPLLSEAPKDISMIQMFWLFVGFMVLSVSIGLAGLAILQFRVVQERAKTIAMLRCIGYSKQLIRQMLMLEGTVIGWLGLLNGLIFGSIGGYYIVNYVESTRNPTEEALSFLYPWTSLLPIVVGLLAVTLVLNLLPSRRLLQLSPGEAIRTSEE